MRPTRVLLVLGAVTLAGSAAVALIRARPAGQPTASPTAQLRPAPDIEIVMYQGQEVVGGSPIALSQLWEQGEPVVLNFWAALCPPCQAEMPDFEQLYRQRPRGSFVLIGVDIGPFIGLGTREEGRALARELQITYPVGTTFDGRTPRNYQIVGMPTTVFITPEGRILRKYVGLLTRDHMNALTDELLRVSRPK